MPLFSKDYLTLVSETFLKSYWFGIRGRLLLAFSVLSAFTLFASFIGWASHTSLSNELGSVAKKNLQVLKLIADVKERATIITITAPLLLSVENKVRQAEISKTLDENIKHLILSTPKISVLLPHSTGQPALTTQFDLLQKIFYNLNKNVDQQLLIKQKILQSNRRMRWASAVFLSDIDSLNSDIRSNLYSHLQRDSEKTKSIINNELQASYSLTADVNLLINMFDRAQYLTDLNSQIATEIHSRDIISRIKANLTILNKRIHLQKIQKTVNHIIALAVSDNNIFHMRQEQRLVTERGQSLLTQTHQELLKLDHLLNTITDSAQKSSLLALKNAQDTIDQGRLFMVLSVAGSLLFSIIIIRLYVGRNMVARISALNGAMKAIAAGDLEREISLKGQDEIGNMARSLRSFRDQLSTLQEELVQTGKLAAVGQLSAGIAHEINQPLSAVRLYVHNSKRLIQINELEEAQENLNNISNLTKRAISIVTRLNAMARNEKINFEHLDLAAVIKSTLEVLLNEKVKDIHCVINETERDCTFVLADPIQLEQVLVNLINNALYAVSDQTEKKITIKCESTTDNVLLMISDNGPGISSELKKKIFDPFFTTKRRGENLGLGLAISYNIIKSFRGQLSIIETPQKGACFCIRLPRKEIKEQVDIPIAK